MNKDETLQDATRFTQTRIKIAIELRMTEAEGAELGMERRRTRSRWIRRYGK